jgi:hypothetical protein
MAEIDQNRRYRLTKAIWREVPEDVGEVLYKSRERID